MAPLLDEAAELDAGVPKKLATLSEHFGPVNCVRWSRSGRYLASGSDDKVILVCERRAGAGTAQFGSAEPPDVENWKVVLHLRGHAADVVDLAWSPGDAQLASCSLDNTVRVWDGRTGAPVVTLEGHGSWVKGVAWDPIGSFLASQSDDRSVAVWQTRDWSLAARIRGPYDRSVGATFFRRLSWSPCGTFLTTTNSYEAPSHTAAVICRGTWTTPFSFVGHRAPVVVVRYGPYLLKPPPPRPPTAPLNEEAGGRSAEPAPDSQNGGGKGSLGSKAASLPNGVTTAAVANGAGGKSPPAGGGGVGQQQHLPGGGAAGAAGAGPFSCLALGSQDCKVTVWFTGSPTPLLIAAHFFDAAVSDLAWASDGCTLLACSTDGTLAAFAFERGELGEPYSPAEMDAFRKLQYGTAAALGAVAESADLLALEEEAAAKVAERRRLQPPLLPQPADPGSMTAAAALAPQMASSAPADTPAYSGTPLAASPVQQQVVTQPDGRRRIIPQALAGAASPLPEVSGKHFFGAGGGSSKEHGGVVAEAPADSVGKLMPPPPPQPGPAQKRLHMVAAAAAGSGAEVGAAGVAPPARASAWSAAPLPPDAVGVSFAAGSGPAELVVRSTGGAQRDTLAVSIKLAPGWLSSPPREDGGGRPQVAVLEERLIGPDPSTSVARSSCSDAEPYAAMLAVCLANRGKRVGVWDSEGREVVCTHGGVAAWHDALPCAASAMAGNAHLWVVACCDGTLQVYTSAGRRALPPMLLGSPVAFLEADSGWRLLAVTLSGDVHLWDLSLGKRILLTTLAPLLHASKDSSGRACYALNSLAHGVLMGNLYYPMPGKLNVVSARLSTASGSPIVVLLNRHAFLFHMAMGVWLRVADDAFPASDFASSWGGGDGAEGGELASLQAGVASEIRAKGHVFGANPTYLLDRRGGETKEQTRAHIEQSLASAEALESAEEYRRWLLSYARHLTREGDVTRLRELCEALLGPSPSVAAAGRTQWEPMVLGFHRRALLREVVLPAMTSNRAIQRLLNEFLDLVKEL
eukprot:SM000114S24132  [mRNA]  locus=s114:115169:120348:- [translate_table: standard]